jgi:hypothetical protein
MTPTVTVNSYVVTVTGIPPGAVVGWGDCRESVADASGTATHDYNAASSTSDRLWPTSTWPGRRLLVITTPSDRWVGHVDVACVQDAW